jgi:hypothetical protein
VHRPHLTETPVPTAEHAPTKSKKKNYSLGTTGQVQLSTD